MAGEIIIFFGIIALVITLVYLGAKKKQTPMSAAELLAYEQEKGRLEAQREFNQYRKHRNPYVFN